MMNKKNPGTDSIFNRHQELIEQFRDSRQTPREFLTRCLESRKVSAADALELMTVLKSKVLTRTFTLADLSDEDSFRLGLYETSQEDTENNPIFVIQFSESVREHSGEAKTLLEEFSRNLAEMVSRHQKEVSVDTDYRASKREAMETILDTLSVDAVRH